MRRLLLSLVFAFAAVAARAQDPNDSLIDAGSGFVKADGGTPLNVVTVPTTPVLGDLIYYDGSQWNRLPRGTDGQCVVQASNIPSWATCGGGGGGAPTTSTYITQTPDVGLSAEQALSALATGLVKNTTATGVLSIYAGTSCTNQFVRSLDASAAATCNSIVNADITAATIALAKIVNAGANSRLLGSGSAGSGASYAELSSSTITFGASSFDVALTTTNQGGAIVKQASSPGTVQTTANAAIDGVYYSLNTGLTTGTADALKLDNTTASSGGATVHSSPAANFCGTAWNSGATQSEVDCYRINMKPQTAGVATPGNMNFDWSNNGGGFVTQMTMSSVGTMISTGGSFIAAGSASHAWTSRSTMQSPADGQIVLFNNALGGFGRLQFGGTSASNPSIKREANTQLSARLADDSAYAGVVADNSWIASSSGAIWKTVQTTDPITTLSTGATTTATAGNLVTGPCQLQAVLGRVTTTITTAANFTVKVTGGNVLNQIGTAVTSNVTLTAGTTYTWVPAAFADQYYTAAATLTVTTNVNPGAGAIHFTVICNNPVPPTS